MYSVGGYGILLRSGDLLLSSIYGLSKEGLSKLNRCSLEPMGTGILAVNEEEFRVVTKTLEEPT